VDRAGHDPFLSPPVAFSRYVVALMPALLAASLAAQTQPVAPQPDQPAAVDAEVRVALFDLLADRPLAAMSRLRVLYTGGSETRIDGGPGAFGQREVQFLLAESYARLGMSSAFRDAARTLLESGDARYAPILRVQLLLDAYRHGDYQGAVSLASNAAASDPALAALIGGLANYRLANYAAAQTAFTTAAASGGAFGGYARYMAALAQMAADTTQTQASMTALQALAGDALGEFADQVNLTIAQLAYQRGEFDAASAAAGRVSAEGGLAAQAALTRAWSLYKASQLDPAAQAFTDFATRFPQLPQRDEARLMVGQVLLQQGRLDDAGAHFQRIADSLAFDVAALSQGSAAAMSQAARAFVQARAATMLFLQSPSTGKALAVPDNLGIDHASLAQALGSSLPATPPEELRPELVTLADVAPRLDSVATAAGPEFPRRVAYVFGGGGETQAEFVRRAQALREADVAVALARFRLAEQLAAHDVRLALLERMQEMMGQATSRLDSLSRELVAARDSLARVSQSAEEQRTLLHEMMQREAEGVRADAANNARKIDSMRTTFTGILSPDDDSLMAIERQTAQVYQQLADNVLAGLDRAFSRHPVIALRDTVQAHIDASEALLDETRLTIASTNQILADEAARMRASDSERTTAARSVVASAEAARATAEGAVLVAVEAELRARAETLLGLVRSDAEAAEFGAASASFFKAVGTSAASGAPSQNPAASGPPGPGSPR
jgi:tetratricopeptide (TPR) repeat protein